MFAGIVAVLAVALIDNGFVRNTVWVAALALVQLPFAVIRIALAATAVAILWMIGIAGVHRWVAPAGLAATAAVFLFFPPIVSRNVYPDDASGKDNSISAIEKIVNDPAHVVNVVRFEGRDRLWSEAIDRMGPDDYVRGHGINAWFAGGTQPYPEAVENDSPALYWRLGETSGRVAQDDTGNGRDGTYRGKPKLGAPGALPGDADTAADLDGTQSVQTTDYDPFVNGATRTFEGWAWRDSNRNADTLFGSVEAAGKHDVLLRIQPHSDDVAFWSDTEPGPSIWKRAWPGPRRWVHWMLTYRSEPPN